MTALDTWAELCAAYHGQKDRIAALEAIAKDASERLEGFLEMCSSSKLRTPAHFAAAELVRATLEGDANGTSRCLADALSNCQATRTAIGVQMRILAEEYDGRPLTLAQAEARLRRVP